MDLECYWYNLEASDKSAYESMFPTKTPIEILEEEMDKMNEKIKYHQFVLPDDIETVVHFRWVYHYLNDAKERIEKECWWIPVTDRLPEKEWEYLTCVDLSYNKTIFHETCIRQLDWDWDNFWDWEWYTHKISHWMPLPTPPNQ